MADGPLTRRIRARSVKCIEPVGAGDRFPKASGIGKEGPRSAVAEMTDTKTVILHGRPW